MKNKLKFSLVLGVFCALIKPVSAQELCENLCDHMWVNSASANDIRKEINNGAGVNDIDNSNNTPLHYAVKSGSLEKIKVLIEMGAHINAQNFSNTQPIHMIASAKSSTTKENLLYLLQSGANIEARNRVYPTALHAATLNENIEAIEALIELGADIDARDDEARTPLHLSIDIQRFKSTKSLLELGASTQSRDIDGESPLHFAAMHGWGAKYIKLLIEHGANPETKNKTNLTPLQVAVITKNAENVAILVALGANIEAKDETNFSALHIASVLGNTEVLDAVIKAGANLNAKGMDDRTALHLSVMEVVNFFGVDKANSDAVKNLELLLKYGADPTIRDILGLIPFDYIKGRDEFATESFYWKLHDAQYD